MLRCKQRAGWTCETWAHNLLLQQLLCFAKRGLFGSLVFAGTGGRGRYPQVQAVPYLEADVSHFQLPGSTCSLIFGPQQ